MVAAVLSARNRQLWRNFMYRYSEKKPGKGKKQAVIAVIAVAAVAAAVAGGVLIAKNVPKTAVSSSSVAQEPVFGDVTVSGVSLKGMTMTKARNAVITHLEKKDQARSYTLTYSSKTYTLSGKDLSITYNVNEVLQKAMKSTVSSSSASSAQSAQKTYTLTPTIDQTSLNTKLKELTSSINCSAKEPTISSFDGSSFSFKEGTPGVKVENDALLQSVVKAMTESDTATLKIQTTEVDCEHTVSDLRKNIVKLGSFTTESVNTENGTYNMAKALRTVNGTVVAAHGTFSYLGTIGGAGEEDGYKLATALENGKAVQSYGGGICQGSTTIYGAAMRSNCTIVERSPHSSPSSYVPIGQDATVSHPDLDFQFGNPTDYPMYISSGAEGRTMYCTIYGYKDSSWDTIEVSSQLTSGTIETGRYASCSRTFYKNGSVVRTEKMPSSYYPPKTSTTTSPSSSKKSSSSSSKATSSQSTTSNKKSSSASSSASSKTSG